MPVQKLPHVPNELLPSIPDKRYFTIGEVSYLCATKPHVLRYWEKSFSLLNPSKRRGNRRYYQREDVLLVRRIRDLVCEQGFTVEGAERKLVHEAAFQPQSSKPLPKAVIAQLISELESTLNILV